MPESARPDEEDDLLADTPRAGAKAFPGLAWLVGAAVCAALVLGVSHRTEEKEFLLLTQKIKPVWVGLALLLQACTYVTQGLVWRITARAAGYRLAMGKACELSLAMLFVDQALPTAGISGMAMASGALSRIGMPRPAVASAILVNISMYYLAYASCMALASGIAMLHDYLPSWVMVAMMLFVLVRLAMAWFVIVLPGGRMAGTRRRLGRVKKLARFLDFLDSADRGFFHDRCLLRRTFGLHCATFLLDATTLWVAVLALGGSVPLGGLFASFMVSTFFRTIGIMPGGLGTFEASSVITLKSIGLPLPLGLSVTLFFRGLSFWLPMLPGLFCSRHLLGKGRNKEG